MPYSGGRRPFRASPEVSTSGRLKFDFMTGRPRLSERKAPCLAWTISVRSSSAGTTAAASTSLTAPTAATGLVELLGH